MKSLFLKIVMVNFFILQSQFVLGENTSAIPGVTLLSTKEYTYKIEEKNFEVSFSPTNDYPYKSFKLYPNRAIVFEIPEAYHQLTVDQLVLIHRQGKNSKNLSENETDYRPGLTSLLFFDPQFAVDEQWRFWPGMHSGKWGAKYAELRSDSIPEAELIYSFNYYGTSSLDKKKSKNDLHPTQVAAVNVGSSPIYLHQIKVRYLPPAPSQFIEHIYSSGTQFDLFNYGRAKSFGGGEGYWGQYPKAWRLKKNKIIISLPANKQLSALDVICGDARGWDSATRKYMPGNTYLNIKWLRNNQLLQNLLIDESVGAQSLLRGIPENIEELTQEGDQIEISSSNLSTNILYIMGYRLGLRDPQP